MTTQTRAAARRFAFDHYLRTGEMLNLVRLEARFDAHEHKFNPNHDPLDGRFTSAPSGAKRAPGPLKRLPGSDPRKKAFYYQGQTKGGLGRIEPVSGGYVDANGQYVPEMFAPDPYALKEPTSALAHYIDGSGEARNFYMNEVNTDHIDLKKSKKTREILERGVAGSYDIEDARAGVDMAKNLVPRQLSSAAIVGGLTLSLNGKLDIDPKGAYTFTGWAGGAGDTFDPHPREGRSVLGDALNTALTYTPGRNFPVYIVGTKRVVLRGRIAR